MTQKEKLRFLSFADQGWTFMREHWEELAVIANIPDEKFERMSRSGQLCVSATRLVIASLVERGAFDDDTTKIGSDP